MLNILLSFAQFERETIADRTSDKMCAARRRGKWTGGIPILGYDLHPDGGKLIVNEDEAPLVREMFRLYLKHRSLMKVATELNQRGWLTKSWTTKSGKHREGREFSKNYVSRHLANPIYIGCVRLKGQVYPGEHQGIIRKSTFEKAQKILTGDRAEGQARIQNKYGHLLKGLVRCGACGTAMIPAVSKKGSKVYRYYVCTNAQKKGAKACPHPSITAHHLEHLVFQQIKVIGQDPALQAETLRQVGKVAREQNATLTAESRRLRITKDKVDAETNGLLKALAGGQASGAAISGRLTELEGKTATLATRLAEIERERKAADAANIDPNDLTTALGIFDPIWDVLFPAEQARIIELLIRQIEYNGKSENLAIAFHSTGIKALAGEITQEGMVCRLR